MDWAKKEESNLSQNLVLLDTDRYTKDELGRNLISEYIETYKKVQWNTPFIPQASLHLIVGQLPAVREMRIPVEGNDLDLRIHICWFQPQSTGKGKGFILISRICDNVGINMKEILEFSDAGLIGGFLDKKVYDPKNKGYNITKEFKPGVLHPNYGSDIISSSEASSVFDRKSNYRQNTLNYFQKTMNTVGTVDNCIPKDVLGGNENIYPTASVFLSSWVPEKFLDAVISSGFVSRCLNIINDVKFKDRIQNMAMSDKSFNTRGKYQESDLDNIIDKLNFINEKYKGVTHLEHSDEVPKYLRRLRSEIVQPLFDINGYHREKLAEFVDRIRDMCWKIMYHSAILRLSDTVDVQDVTYAESMIMPIWKNFIGYIGDALEERGDMKSKKLKKKSYIVKAFNLLEQKKMLNTEGFVPLPKLVEITTYMSGRSKQTVKKWIDDMEDNGYIEIKHYRKADGIKIIGKSF